MVEIKDLTKYYGNISAVKGISFTVNDNEILGFLGPNGAGKSTTMNMITGYLPCTSGTITVDGIELSDNPSEVKKKIGYLPELPPLYMDMRVIEYLTFVAGLKGVPRKEQKKQVEKAMERLHITDVQKRIIRNLSKGYKQRVGFAQALLGNPKFLILDEPTVGLDPQQVMEVRQLIRDLKKDHTIIFSSHILSEVSAICERVVIINKGEIKAIDTIENLEKSLSDTKAFIVKIEGPQEAVTEALKRVPGVTSVTDVTYEKTNVYNYSVRVEGDDVRKAIMKAMLDQEFMVLEITQEKMSLEEVFVKITGSRSTDKKSLHDIVEELGSEYDAQNEKKEDK